MGYSIIVLSGRQPAVPSSYAYGCSPDAVIVSKAFHMLFDCLALSIGLYASVVSRWKPNRIFSFGYGRVEILCGYVNSVLLTITCFRLFCEGVKRIHHPPVIEDPEWLLAASVGGLLINLLGILGFRHGRSFNHSGKVFAGPTSRLGSGAGYGGIGGGLDSSMMMMTPMKTPMQGMQGMQGMRHMRTPLSAGGTPSSSNRPQSMMRAALQNDGPGARALSDDSASMSTPMRPTSSHRYNNSGATNSDDPLGFRRFDGDGDTSPMAAEMGYVHGTLHSHSPECGSADAADGNAGLHMKDRCHFADVPFVPPRRSLSVPPRTGSRRLQDGLLTSA